MLDLEEIINSPPTDPLPPNSHWLDPNGYLGMSEYFWRSKCPQICECTGVDPPSI